MATAEPTAVAASGPETRTGLLSRYRNMNRDKREQALVAYLFLLPDVLGLLVFLVGPMISGPGHQLQRLAPDGRAGLRRPAQLRDYPQRPKVRRVVGPHHPLYTGLCARRVHDQPGHGRPAHPKEARQHAVPHHLLHAGGDVHGGGRCDLALHVRARQRTDQRGARRPGSADCPMDRQRAKLHDHGA